MSRARGFDYIIVGAGSAGCVLANLLTASGDASVLLLEAGGWDHDPWIKIPIGWGRIMQRRLHDWGYDTEPDAAIGNRSMECMRGKVIGGSSSINAMAYVRGNRADFDRWASYGLPDLAYPRVLPVFKAQESWQGGASFYRGGDGPLSVSAATYGDPLAQACLEASVEAGFPQTEDYNGEQQEGFSVLQSTIRRGRRCSAADAFLRPALGRRNLKVLTRALVTGLEFEGDRAVSLSVRRKGKLERYHAGCEIILCAGAINTPQILMLSGIGDPVELTRHGIRPRLSLPGVGKNLQDHATVAVEFERSGDGPFVRNLRADRIARSLLEAYLFGKGFATDLPSGWTAFLRTSLADSVPDIQLIFRAVPLSASPWFPFLKAPFRDGFGIRSVVLRPESRGEILLRSADPADKVRIRQNLLQAETDRRRIREALRMTRHLAAQEALRSYIGKELAPGEGNWSDVALDEHIGRFAATAHHPAGTCRMGAGNASDIVLDPEFRVRGAGNLRVVDASAFPDLIGGNINAAVMMLAQQAAQYLLDRRNAATKPRKHGFFYVGPRGSDPHDPAQKV